MTEALADNDGTPEFPMATTTQPSLIQGPGARWWWLSIFCLFAAVGITIASVYSGGKRIAIQFDDGHGIKAGDAVRHRGIDVGRVMTAQLDTTHNRVRVTVELEKDAAPLARAGTEFWIERPQVSLSGVRGLDTVVGAKYIGVRPGPVEGAPQREFQGLDSPPVLAEIAPGKISIHFKNGGGLDTGDLIKYRGIVIGEITAVDLNASLSGVDVSALLRPSATSLARRGTLFWIERPRLGLTEVRGLDTFVDGVYLGLLPGPEDGEVLREFEGLEEPPANEFRAPGGLEIILYSKQRFGIQRGSPLTYRGIQVGHVLAVGLSTDALFVEARVYVHPAYRELVRDNSKFWSSSGVDVDVGFTGVEIAYDTLATIAAGGVAVATPDNGSDAAATGKRFELFEEPDEDWFDYDARVSVGAALLPDKPLPDPLRASLSWRTKTFGISSMEQRAGWMLALRDGRLLGPSTLLTPAADALDGSLQLEINGEPIDIDPTQTDNHGALAFHRLPNGASDAQRAWPIAALRSAKSPEDCLIVPGAQSRLVPIGAGRLSGGEGRWTVDSTWTVDDDWHGAPVVAVADGSIIGLFLVEDRQGAIATMP